MMSSTVVKSCQARISSLLGKFGSYIRCEKVRHLTRKHPNDFVRIFKFPWYDVLLYLIFRSENCTQSELSKYYSDIGKTNLRISKQAAFKALKKVNPDVFSDLIHTFARFFYESDLVKTYKGYILLSEDGTANELRPSKKALNQFGFVTNQFIRNKDAAQKATSRSAAFYDITNGFIVNFTMNPYKKSEIPIAIEHLTNCHSLFDGRKIIYLADRYYGCIELFAILESYGFQYCIRGKSNFFKKYVSQMKSNDEWIEVKLDKTWLKRLKYDIAKERFQKNPTIQIRVVKKSYTYTDKKGNIHHTDLIYFTNLSEKEFSTNEIVSLYAKRWDIESSYKTLKTNYEWERFFSEDCDCEMCCIYAKVIYHNLIGIIRKELNDMLILEDKNKSNIYKYTTNIVQLSKLMSENNLCRWIRSCNGKAIEKLIDLTIILIHKIKIPIRPGRHNQRWGRIVTCSSPIRFRLDGRNWPRTSYSHGKLRTTQP